MTHTCDITGFEIDAPDYTTSGQNDGLLNKQIAKWEKEIERLKDLVACSRREEPKLQDAALPLGASGDAISVQHGNAPQPCNTVDEVEEYSKSMVARMDARPVFLMGYADAIEARIMRKLKETK